MSGLYFEKCFATDTRLMGVVVIKTYLLDSFGERQVMLSHLDYETYGYDGLTLLPVEDDEWISDEVYGGLGGHLVEINPSEAKYLIRKSLEIGLENIDEYDLPLVSYYDFADDLPLGKIEALNRKVCMSPRSEYECINYYLMRLIGDDLEMVRFIHSGSIPKRYPKDSTFMRSKIMQENKQWIVSALVLSDRVYSVDRYILEMDGVKISKIILVDELEISDTEAAMQLSQTEYILVYDVESIEDVFECIDNNLMNKMIGEYDNGVLFTVFNTDNDHVNQPIYRLNGDVDYYLYLTDEDQLLLVFRDENQKKEKIRLVKELLNGYNVQMLGKFDFNHQILYDFIQSEYGDFLDYLEEEFR